MITLKAARVNKDLTLKEAAEKLGVSLYTVHSWETYKTYPNIYYLKRIEELYGVEYKDIKFFLDEDNG